MSTAPRKERGRTRGRPFQPGNGGRPKGALDRRTLVAREVAGALAAKAWGEIEELLQDENARLRLEAARVVLLYAHGAPRQSLEVTTSPAEWREAMLAIERMSDSELDTELIRMGCPPDALASAQSQTPAPPLSVEAVPRPEMSKKPGAVQMQETTLRFK